MRLSLLPRTTEFYDLFREAGINALEAARAVESRFREFPNSSVTQAHVKKIEHQGDRITHALVQLLNTQYITPFDREDIYQLAMAIDDVVDHLDEASELLELYGVESCEESAVKQSGILMEAIEHLATALGDLKEMRGVQQELVYVKDHEDEGDRVLREALAKLFQESNPDPLEVIRWKDIFEALEDALDSCETAANVLANIVVKNA